MPTVLHGLLAAALAIPAAPAMPAAATPRDCTLGHFTAHSQADLARIAVLNPGPLAEGLPALADIGLASATGTVDSSAQPYRSVATGRHADARVLGLPAGGAGAFHAEPSRKPPSTKDLARFRAAGIATSGTGRATAHATWNDEYHCGRTGPLTRATTMLSGLSVLDGMHSGPHRTSLLKIGPVGSVQSATDLIDLGRGRIGVRAGAGVALSDLTLFGGTPHQITITVISQPALEAIAGGDRAHSGVTYRPATLAVRTAGKPAHVLKDSGAEVSLGVLGGLGPDSPSPLQARVSLGEVRQKIGIRQVRADAATLRIEVRLGVKRLLDVTLGNLSVESGAPDRVRQGGGDRPVSGGDWPRPGRPLPGDYPDNPGGDSPDYPDSTGGDSPDSTDGDSPDAPDSTGGDSPDNPDSPDDDTPDSPDDDTPDVATPSRTASRSATPALVPAPAANRDTLALTGSDVTTYGYAGGGLILAGLAALLLTRRRRVSNR